jgi:hypothetical protein
MKFFVKSRIASAVRDRDLKRLSALLEGEDVNMKLDGDGWTALHYAASAGAEDIAEYLLKKGASPNAADRNKWTPLHFAAGAGRLGVVIELLKSGADPNLRTVEGRTAYGWANLREHKEIAEVLAPYMKKLSELVQLPEPPAWETPPDAAEWTLLSGQKIARVSVESAIGYRITEIFNFASRERTTLYQNLETRAESAQTRFFDQLGDKAALEEALAELQKRGGAADMGRIRGIDKKKFGP